MTLELNHANHAGITYDPVTGELRTTAAATSAAQQYVTTDGSDSNNGLSWATAKATVKAAVLALPTLGSAGSLRHAGSVTIGAGTFTEAGDIELNADLVIQGQGTSNNGTIIQLADNANQPLFQPSAAFVDWSHHIVFRSVKLEGNKANQTGSHSLVRIFRGGFNTAFYDVFFRGASGAGLEVVDNAVNLYITNCSGAHCDGPFFKINMPASANMTTVAMYGIQVDDCGESAIQIDDASNGDAKTFYISGAEFEAIGPDKANRHHYIINYNRTGGNPSLFIVDGLNAYHDSANGLAIIHEAAGTGRYSLTGVKSTTNYAADFLKASNSFGFKFADRASMQHGIIFANPTQSKAVRVSHDNSEGLTVTDVPTGTNTTLQYRLSGVTASRPSTTGFPVRRVGMEYFDTTLGIPVWWNGTNWVDATGATA